MESDALSDVSAWDDALDAVRETAEEAADSVLLNFRSLPGQTLP